MDRIRCQVRPTFGKRACGTKRYGRISIALLSSLNNPPGIPHGGVSITTGLYDRVVPSTGLPPMGLDALEILIGDTQNSILSGCRWTCIQTSGAFAIA